MRTFVLAALLGLAAVASAQLGEPRALRVVQGSTLVVDETDTLDFDALHFSCAKTAPGKAKCSLLPGTASGQVRMWNGSAWVYRTLTMGSDNFNDDGTAITLGANVSRFGSAIGAANNFRSAGAGGVDLSGTILQPPAGTGAASSTDCDATGEIGRLRIQTDAAAFRKPFYCDSVANGWVPFGDIYSQGRSNTQTINGGNATGGSLVLKSNTSADGNVTIGDAAGTMTVLAPVTASGGAQPASVAGNGTNAPTALALTSVDGGNTSGTTGQSAGRGGNVTITTGAGGQAPAGSTNGEAGDIILQPGLNGQGAGTAASDLSIPAGDRAAMKANSGGVIVLCPNGKCRIQAGVHENNDPDAFFQLMGPIPPSQAGNGITAQQVLSVTGGVGGATSGTTGQVAGNGASIIYWAGTGGAAPAGSTAGNGGDLLFASGFPGGGGGTPGAYGIVKIQPFGVGYTYIGNRLGMGTLTPSYDLSFTGQAAKTIGLERHTTAANAGNSLTIQAGGAVSGGTSLTGGTLTLSSGIATGNSAGSQVDIKTVTGLQGGTTADRTPAVAHRFRDGHLVTVGGAAPAISSCGTGSPSLTTGSTDTAGSINVGNGTVTTCSITFAKAYITNAPFCVITPIGDAGALRVWVTSTTTTTLTLGSSATINGKVIGYHCDGWE